MDPEASRAGETKRGVRGEALRTERRGTERLVPGHRGGGWQGCQAQPRECPVAALSLSDTRVVSGCAWVRLSLSCCVVPCVGTPRVPRSRVPAQVVFVPLGVSVCAVWCLWVCLCGLCWCVARLVCACLISQWPAGPCSCMTCDTGG